LTKKEGGFSLAFRAARAEEGDDGLQGAFFQHPFLYGWRRMHKIAKNANLGRGGHVRIK
jgi:hypothetical protein